MRIGDFADAWCTCDILIVSFERMKREFKVTSRLHGGGL